MILTIQHDNGNTYIWRTGDEPADLLRAINILQTAIASATSPVGIATSPQTPLPTPNVNAPISH